MTLRKVQKSQSNSGRLIILSGPSGVGKTSVASLLLKTPGFGRVVTATTRSPRPGERHEVDYRFMDRESFLEAVASGEFLEHAEVHGNLYGTPREAVNRGLDGHDYLLLIIDVQGARQIRENLTDMEFTSVFLLPPSLEELERRLTARETESGTTLRKRLEEARSELDEQRFYDYRVCNDDLGRATREILASLGASDSSP